MSERLEPYDAAAYSRYIREKGEAKKAAEATQTADIAQKLDRMEAEGNPVGPWDPLISKLVNPRIR